METYLNPKRNAEICELGRNEVKVLTGHGSLDYYRHKIELADKKL